MRVVLRTYPTRIEAEMVADELRELDLPIVVMSTATLDVFVGTAVESEVWLEDDTILENPVWQAQIEEVLCRAAIPLTPEEEDEIAKMPPED